MKQAPESMPYWQRTSGISWLYVIECLSESIMILWMVPKDCRIHHLNLI